MVGSTRVLWFTLAAVVAVAGGSGCTTQLEAKRIATATDVPVAGAPYYLPFTQFTISITRRVTACGPGPDESGKYVDEAITIKVIPTITGAEVPDPQRLYVIDFDSLQSAMKKTNVKVQYHPNGMLKAVNAAAEDRTGPVVIGAVTTLAKIAVTAATGGGAAVAADVDATRPGCSEVVLKALETIGKQVPLIEPTAAAVTRLAGELASLTAQGQVLGKAWPPEGRALWARKQQELADATGALSKLQSDVAGALSALSVVEPKPFLWPTTGEDRGPTQVPVAELKDEQIKKWGTFDKPTQDRLKAPVLVYVSLTSKSPIARTKACPAGDTSKPVDPECARDDSVAGLKYRVPAAGSLSLCMKKGADAGCEALAAVSGPISQLGPVFTLPLRSGAFTNKNVTAVFDEQGRPLELGVVSSAAAEEAVTTAGAVTDTVLKARESVVKTRLERLKEETEILKAEKELAAAGKALEAPTEQQTELVALQADTALLTGRLANLQAQEALQKAQQITGP